MAPDATLMVLVVDDEPVLRRLMERALLDAGYGVCAASGALPALDALDTLPSPPRALVTDIRMEPVDGVGLARMIHAQWPGLPVLFVSGFASPGEYGELPGQVLQKPFKPEHLVEAVDRLIGRARAAAS